MSEVVKTPFTKYQIRAINTNQSCGYSHVTCGDVKCNKLLKATEKGLVCSCGNFKQDWVEKYMTIEKFNNTINVYLSRRKNNKKLIVQVKKIVLDFFVPSKKTDSKDEFEVLKNGVTKGFEKNELSFQEISEYFRNEGYSKFQKQTKITPEGLILLKDILKII